MDKMGDPVDAPEAASGTPLDVDEVGRLKEQIGALTDLLESSFAPALAMVPKPLRAGVESKYERYVNLVKGDEDDDM